MHDSAFETSHSKQSLQDLKYAKFISHGQDTFLNAVTTFYIDYILVEPIWVIINTNTPVPISKKLAHNLSRGAPISADRISIINHGLPNRWLLVIILKQQSKLVDDQANEGFGSNQGASSNVVTTYKVFIE